MLLKKKPLFFTLIAAITVVTSQNALALLGSGNVDYDRIWNGESLTGRVEYAVYNRTEYEAAWSGLGLSAPGTGQYVYAYMITNNSLSSDVAYFAISGLTGDNSSGIVYEDTETGGIEPYCAYLNESQSKGIWEWSNQVGYNFIQMAQHSWLLLYSSDQLPVVGEGEIRGQDLGMENVNDTINLLVPDVPEPATLLLLGIGVSILGLRRNRRLSSRQI